MQSPGGEPVGPAYTMVTFLEIYMRSVYFVPHLPSYMPYYFPKITLNAMGRGEQCENSEYHFQLTAGTGTDCNANVGAN